MLHLIISVIYNEFFRGFSASSIVAQQVRRTSTISRVPRSTTLRFISLKSWGFFRVDLTFFGSQDRVNVRVGLVYILKKL